MLGQSAIEYLMTYGWMLLVVAITGSAVFAVAQNDAPNTVNGLTGDVRVNDFGVTSNEDIQLEISDGSGQGITVTRVNISDRDTGRYVSKTFRSQSRVSVGDSKIFELPNISRSDGNNVLDVEITYSSSDLTNLTASGTISGSIRVEEDSGVYYGDLDSHNSGDSEDNLGSTGFQYYTDFSQYSDGSNLNQTSNWTISGDESGAFQISENVSFEGSKFVNYSASEVALHEGIGEIDDFDVYTVTEDLGTDNRFVATGRMAINSSMAYGWEGYAAAAGGSGGDGGSYSLNLYYYNNTNPYGHLIAEDSSITYEFFNNNARLSWRFNMTDDDLKLKVWPEGSEEPDAWNLTATHSSPSAKDSGYLGFGAEAFTDSTKWDVFAVGLNGSKAPKTP